MKKAISCAFFIVGTVIGAGFASGQEMAVFFSSPIHLTAPIISGILFFLTITLFLRLASLRAKNVQTFNKIIAGRAHGIFNVFLLFNAFVVLSATLSAFDYIGGEIFVPSRIYSVLGAIACATVVYREISGLIRVNATLVPLIIVIISVIGIFCARSGGVSLSVSLLDFPRAVMYVSMNTLLACTTVTGIGELSKREILLTATISSVIITLLMFLVACCVNSYPITSGDMPLLTATSNMNTVVKIAVCVVLAVAIFTTMIAATHTLYQAFLPIINDKFLSFSFVLICAFIVSTLGFNNVVSLLYPIISVTGLVYCVVAFRYACVSRYKKLYVSAR